MQITYRNDVDLTGNKIKNATFEHVNDATAYPANPVDGQMIIRDDTHKLMQYVSAESEWVEVSSQTTYKGYLGTGAGQTADLPSTGIKAGDMWYVAEAGEYTIDATTTPATVQMCQVGDQFRARKDVKTTAQADSWTYIPSGNDIKTGTFTGDGTTTSFDIVHNLNSPDVSATFKNQSTGEIEMVYYKPDTTTPNNKINVVFNVAPENSVIYSYTVRK